MTKAFESSVVRLLAGALALVASSTACAEKANVFFVHGANVSLQDERAWASAMFKRLWQAGADMEFRPVSWESDIGAPWNYHANVSNAFVMAGRLAASINAEPGRNVVIAHSLGTLVAAAAIQDHGARVDRLIMLNSAIPSEAFDPGLFDPDPQNHLVHDDWTAYPSACWTSRWHELFAAGDSRSRLTWRGRFAAVASVAVNFYSSGDEVLELYAAAHNPAFYDGISPSGHWGERYSWHKQELWKGRKSLLGFMGTTDWSGWGFATKTVYYPGMEEALSVNRFTPAEAAALTPEEMRTNTVFRLCPASMADPASPRLATDFHLAYGIPALSPPTGRTDLNDHRVTSFDMNAPEFRTGAWPRPPARPGSDDLGDSWLHSDIKDVAYFYTHKVFDKIVEVGGLK